MRTIAASGRTKSVVGLLVASMAPFLVMGADWHCYDAALNVTVDENGSEAVLREFRSAAARANMQCSPFEPFFTVVRCTVDHEHSPEQGRFVMATYYGPRDTHPGRVAIEAYLAPGTPGASKARALVVAIFARLRADLKAIPTVVGINEWVRDPSATKSDCLGDGQSS